MRTLVFAYACEPDKGSEPGAGWTWVRMIARSASTVVLTRANNRESIERALPRVPEATSLRFVYIDLPAWARFWKREQRGIRLYYLLWQAAALRQAVRLNSESRFDVVWHLTLANAWLGSAAAFVDAPFVYGPVGGGVPTPWRLCSALGLRGTAYELIRAAARWSARYCNPLARLAWRRASIVLVQNPETRAWLPRRHRPKCVVLQHAVADVSVLPGTASSGEHPTAVFASRLIPWKGGELALRAIAGTSGWRLVICGGGRDEHRLRTLARELRVEDRTQFRGKLAQGELHALMSNSDALLHPSFHDDSPLAVTEALAHGLPVVCLDRGGPSVLAGDAGLVVESTGDVSATVARLSSRLEDVSRESFRQRARRRAEDLSFESRTRVVRELLQSVSIAPVRATRSGPAA
jgi:glycosyltransferase involved in cell wall biosynthesis